MRPSHQPRPPRTTSSPARPWRLPRHHDGRARHQTRPAHLLARARPPTALLARTRTPAAGGSPPRTPAARPSHAYARPLMVPRARCPRTPATRPAHARPGPLSAPRAHHFARPPPGPFARAHARPRRRALAAPLAHHLARPPHRAQTAASSRALAAPNARPRHARGCSRPRSSSGMDGGREERGDARPASS
jgi:hypothetical protein